MTVTGRSGDRPRRRVDTDPAGAPTQITDLKRLLSGPPAKLHVLRLTAGPGAPQEFVLPEGQSVVGRASEADISLRCQTLSKKHVRLTVDGGEVMCLDLDSRNGVVLNGVRVRSAVLRDGDLVQLGDVAFTYLERFA